MIKKLTISFCISPPEVLPKMTPVAVKSFTELWILLKSLIFAIRFITTYFPTSKDMIAIKRCFTLLSTEGLSHMFTLGDEGES